MLGPGGRNGGSGGFHSFGQRTASRRDAGLQHLEPVDDSRAESVRVPPVRFVAAFGREDGLEKGGDPFFANGSDEFVAAEWSLGT